MEKEKAMAERTKAKQADPLNQKRGWQKWAGRIGKFLLYGGWILVLFAVLAIIILVSILTH